MGRNETISTTAQQVTQDDRTVNSEMTLETIDNVNRKITKEFEEEKGDNSKIITQDDHTVTSEMTLETIAKKPAGECRDLNKEKNEKEANIDAESVMTGFTTVKETIRNTENENKSNENKDIVDDLKGPNQELKEGNPDNEGNKGNTNDNDEEGNSVVSDLTKATIDKKEKPEKQEVKKVTNPYNTPNSKATKAKSYVSVAEGKTQKQVSEDETDDNVIETNKHQIRLRFSFTKRTYEGSDKNYIKQVLYEMMRCAKEIDVGAGLMTWESGKKLKVLNGNEVRLQMDSVIKQYIDLPKTASDYRDGETYYGNGIRISTNVEINEFINRWNYKRYDRKNDNPFKNWKAVKPAEAQGFTNTIPIGYFIGTTEKGYYKTVQESVCEEFGGEVELSYQTIYQPGISQRIWNEATAIAHEANKDTRSREHKRIKFGMAPSALVVYVKDETKITDTRKHFMDSYGVKEGDKWPQLHDGSSMRFMPMVDKYVTEKETRDQLYEALRHQAMSKSGEVLLDLKYCNITENTDYFKGKTLEQIIHEQKSKTDEDIPLYKHITTRWDNRLCEMQYEVAVASSLLDEARERLMGMNNYLLTTYGEKARRHFLGAQYDDGNSYTMRKRNYSATTGECDDEIKQFVQRNTITDKISKVLIEGMQEMQMSKDKGGSEKAMLIVESEKKEKSKEPNQRGKKNEIIYIDHDKSSTDSNKANEDEITDLSGDDSYVQQLDWDEISLAGEFVKCDPATPHEKKKALTTMSRRGIRLGDVEDWKNKHWLRIEKMIEKCEGNEYETIKAIVKEILAEKAEKREVKEKSNTDASTNNQVTQEPSNEKEANTTNTGVDYPTNDESLSTTNENEWTVVGKGRRVR